ncbi:hypothetical protein CY34DRAFT_15601 [Suillus luteus UH-Slu-Lm8-n1]|uniref:Uncharacterized protein n=1 Tax=Suillus luteus UH-Slu-Lm8-n1 TaxID=930992 RepID=A0A0D0ATJ6_9AGAM|nr:hypothetical protein CY34DRAFT_15601 [Suillus luteus UH-Slu-Lm8-n1]
MSAVQLTGIAIFEHVRQSGKGLTFLFDAQFFPATNGPLVVLLKYFNRNGELSFTDGSRFFVEANVTKMIDSVDPHYTEDIPEESRLTTKEFDMVGDIVWLCPAPKVNPPSRLPIFRVAGVAFNTHASTASFKIHPEQYVSLVKEAAGSTTTASIPAVKVTACPVLATIPDSPRYKFSKKPLPTNGRYIFMSGFLTKVERNNEEHAVRFCIDVETIAFLGNSLIAPRAASRTPAKNCSTTKKLKYTFDDTDEENNTSTPLKRKLSVASDASLTQTE